MGIVIGNDTFKKISNVVFYTVSEVLKDEYITAAALNSIISIVCHDFICNAIELEDWKDDEIENVIIKKPRVCTSHDVLFRLQYEFEGLTDEQRHELLSKKFWYTVPNVISNENEADRISEIYSFNDKKDIPVKISFVINDLVYLMDKEMEDKFSGSCGEDDLLRQALALSKFFCSLYTHTSTYENFEYQIDTLKILDKSENKAEVLKARKSISELLYDEYYFSSIPKVLAYQIDDISKHVKIDYAKRLYNHFAEAFNSLDIENKKIISIMFQKTYD